MDQVALAVVLDNHSAARPQAGLSSACLVYEFPVEGGMTRLLAFFLHAEAAVVGPVRSARDYMLDPCLETGAILCHIGGSPQAYERLARVKVRSLDDMKGAGAYYRVSYRRPPHNLYTATSALRQAAAARGWARRSAGAAWGLAPGPAVSPATGGEPAATISLRYPGPGEPYLGYRYDPQAGVFLRLVSGEPQIDAANGQAVSVANLVVLRTVVTPIAGDPEGRLRVQMVGEGEALLFRGGQVFKGRWSKAAPALPTRLSGPAGQLVLGPGPTWVEVVPEEAVVQWR
ncbi:MAG: DUF3048 domain-containing protein [Acetobacteraceae bacterium]|nr:DUF3048 domain-containing protein [Acetobacteraceae bacterium]